MESQPTKRRFNLPIIYLVVIIISGLLIPRLINGFGTPPKEIPYSEFKTALYAGKVSSVSVGDIHINGKMADGTTFTTLRVNDPDLIKALEAQKVEASGLVESSGGGILGTLATWILPLVLMVGVWYFLIGRNMKGGAGSAGGIFSFGKSKARVIQGEQTGVTFKDVGGAGEAITDLKEVTEFLKNPVHLPAPGRQNAQRRPAGWPTWHRKDAACQGYRRRGRRAVLQPERGRVCGDVCRRRRIAGARSLRSGQEKRPIDHLYR